MAKSSSILVKLVSTAGTGYFKVRKRNAKAPEKLSARMHDPIARKHVQFVEKKI